MTRDPLIVAANLAIGLVRMILILGALVMLICIGFALFASETQLVETTREMLDMGAQGLGRHSLFVVFCLALVLLVLAERFFQQLQAIVKTVPAGNPFAPVNAERLQRMAWLALGVQIVGLLGALLSAGTAALSDATSDKVDMTLDVSFEGIFLALILFVLARVFREGAAMREDLEGTV